MSSLPRQANVRDKTRAHDCFIFRSDAKCQAFRFNLFYCNLAMIVSLTGEIRSSNWMSLSELSVTPTFISHQYPARDGAFAWSWQDCRLNNVLIIRHIYLFVGLLVTSQRSQRSCNIQVLEVPFIEIHAMILATKEGSFGWAMKNLCWCKWVITLGPLLFTHILHSL